MIHFLLYCSALVGLLLLHEFTNWQAAAPGREQENRYQSILLLVTMLMISDWMVIPLTQLDLVQQLIEQQKRGWGGVGPLMNTGRWLLLYLPVALVVLWSAMQFKRQWLWIVKLRAFSVAVMGLVLLQSFYYLGLMVEDLQISGWIGRTLLLQESAGFIGWTDSKEQLTAQFVWLTAILVMLYTLYRRRMTLLQE